MESKLIGVRLEAELGDLTQLDGIVAVLVVLVEVIFIRNLLFVCLSPEVFRVEDIAFCVFRAFIQCPMVEEKDEDGGKKDE